MSRIVYFLQIKGGWVCIGHLLVGIVLTSVFTVLGIAFYGVAGGWISALFMWQSHLLWSFLKAGFVESYRNGLPVYAGLPFMVVWWLGIFSGIPIYTLASMLIHYILSGIRGTRTEGVEGGCGFGV